MNRPKMVRVITGFTRRFLPLVGAGCLWATLAAGCLRGGGKTADGASPADAAAPVKPEFRYKVAADTTDFFHISPQQPGGADEHLKKETRITLVKRYGGYSEIKTAGGTTGYVPSDEIAPLSAPEISQEDAALRARQAPAAALLGPGPGGPGAAYAIPSQATRETVLPVPDATPTPNPMFRY